MKEDYYSDIPIFEFDACEFVLERITSNKRKNRKIYGMESFNDNNP
jgi:hypothetical protein